MGFIINFKQLNIGPFIQIDVYKFTKRLYKAHVKNDSMRTIWFKSNQRLYLCFILCILHVLIIFTIHQTIYSFPNKWKPLLRNFSNVSCIIVKKSTLQLLSLTCILVCVNTASNNSFIIFGALVKSIGSIKSSVIRQKGESQNGCFKKTKHSKFSEKFFHQNLTDP